MAIVGAIAWPSTGAHTIYNRFNRWSYRDFLLKLLDALVDTGAVARITAAR